MPNAIALNESHHYLPLTIQRRIRYALDLFFPRGLAFGRDFCPGLIRRTVANDSTRIRLKVKNSSREQRYSRRTTFNVAQSPDDMHRRSGNDHKGETTCNVFSGMLRCFWNSAIRRVPCRATNGDRPSHLWHSTARCATHGVLCDG